ncbi:hypothetical protein CC79DRAFT_1361873 [Sarocladium strictum]
MKYSIALTSLAVALPMVAAAPTDSGIKTAIYRPGDNQKRDDIPDSCLAMIDTRQQGAPEWNFYWNGDGKDACATEERSGSRNCGQDGYWDTQIDDMNKSIGEQVTKDGQFKSSEAGMWRSTFGTFTTAVGDRQGFKDFVNTAFKVTFPGNPEPGRYWSYCFFYKGDIIHLNLDNGGIFNKNCPDAA